MTDRTHLGPRLHEACLLTGTFTLRSGQQATEYFDKFLFTTDPTLLREVAGGLAALLPADAEIVAGLELGAVPLAAALSLETGLPAVYVRKAAKGYGTRKLAEGPDVAGRRVVVVEDVVTSGGQILLSAADLRDAGAIVDDVLCVVDREAGGADALAAAGLRLRPLFTMAEIAGGSETSRGAL